MKYPAKISTAVNEVAGKAVGKDWSLYSVLMSRWEEIAGDEHARVTSPLKISFPKGFAENGKERRTGGTLHISVPQGLVMEFSFLTEGLKQRVNGFFGYEAIEKIALTPYYGSAKMPPKPPEKAADPLKMSLLANGVKSIENEELRLALEDFCESVLKSGD